MGGFGKAERERKAAQDHHSNEQGYVFHIEDSPRLHIDVAKQLGINFSVESGSTTHDALID